MNTELKKDAIGAIRREESLDPGKNVLMPDIYADEYAVEETGLEAVPGDDESPDIDLSKGFNPYDTGVLYKK